MLYGYTPFRGKTRQKTFTNILHKDLKFPGSIPVSFPKHLANEVPQVQEKFSILICSSPFNSKREIPFYLHD